MLFCYDLKCAKYNLIFQVDSQVRCLLDECSIDFITKFEDLADVINNSSSSDSKQT